MKKLLAVSLTTILLAGCATNEAVQYSRTDLNRGKVRQSDSTANAGAKYNAPVMIRIFKEEKIVELWKQDKDGRWQTIKTYEICNFSGTIGPKLKQGDYQAPEGFYEITRSQLNPYSSEYLSFNTGYPNERDKANKATGSALMIHGGCSSAGCYAITDKSMEELYAAVRDALLGGQKSVQLQIYPFKMRDWRMMFMKEDKNYNFWRELKFGWDWFDDNHKPVPVSVKNGKYVIN
jgi:hypothetical protein